MSEDIVTIGEDTIDAVLDTWRETYPSRVIHAIWTDNVYLRITYA